MSFDGQQGVLVVKTPPVPGNGPREGRVVVSLRVGDAVAATSTDLFRFAAPSVASVAPSRGPASGGTRVVLEGTDLDVGKEVAVRVDASTCMVVKRTPTKIICTTAQATPTTTTTDAGARTSTSSNANASASRGLGRLARAVPPGTATTGTAPSPGSVCVQIDGMLTSGACVAVSEGGAVAFATQADPVVASVAPRTGPASGGVVALATGTNLDAAAWPHVVFNGTNGTRTACTHAGATLRCTMPAWPEAGPVGEAGAAVALGYHFDGAAVDGGLFVYYPDPAVTDVTPLTGLAGSRLEVTGRGLERGGVPTVVVGQAQALVSISDDGKILFTVPPQPQPDADGNTSAVRVGGGAEANITLSLGSWSFVYPEPFVYATQGGGGGVVTINITSYQNNTQIIVGASGDARGIEGSVAGGVLGGIAFLLLAVFVAYQYKSYQQRVALDAVLTKMNLLESQVVEVCKQGFAELQAVRKVKVSETDTLLLQRSYNDFIERTLFTHQDTHPMPPPHTGPGVAEPVAKFRALLGSAQFLVAFVGAIEESGEVWSMKDRVYVAGLLQVIFHDEADQGLDQLFSLLDVYFERPSSKKQPKLALRRTECVAEKFLTCWLSCQMYGLVTDKVSRPIYELLNALQVQVRAASRPPPPR